MPVKNFISIGENGLQITPYATDITEARPTSTLFFRQQHNCFTASVNLQYKPTAENELAGMVCYQKESFNYVFGITRKGNECYLLLQRTNNGKSEIVANTPVDMQQPLYLQIQAEGDKYTFNYSTDGHSFKKFREVLFPDDILLNYVAGGFTGNMIGLYATSANMAHPQ